MMHRCRYSVVPSLLGGVCLIALAVGCYPPSTLARDTFVSSGADNAEERHSGTTYAHTYDLELVEDGTAQIVGLRFASLLVPAGAEIYEAHIQFVADETSLGSTELTIRAQASANAPSFSEDPLDVSSRPLTQAFKTWTPPGWEKPGDRELAQQTPNLKRIVQQLVDRDDWEKGNPIVFVITGFGKRVAESYHGAKSLGSLKAAPSLHVEYAERMAADRGIPFGAHSRDEDLSAYPFTAGMPYIEPDPDDPNFILTQLSEYRQNGRQLLVSLSTPVKKHYRNADGAFDLERWKAMVDRYRGIDFQEFIDDRTILAHFLVSEPKAAVKWGSTVIPNDVIDEMARYSKEIWPDLPTVVREHPTTLISSGAAWKVPWSPEPYEWMYLDMAWLNYSAYKGPVEVFIDEETRSAHQQGLGIATGMNIVTGGDGTSGRLGPPGYEYSPNGVPWWTMTAPEAMVYGAALIKVPETCFFMLWRFVDPADWSYWDLPQSTVVLRYLRGIADRRPRPVSSRC